MPSLTVLTEDKAVIRRALPPTTTKIFMATVARLYVAHPDPNHWTYSNIMGALVFVRDEIKNSFFLRIVDLRAGRGVIWEQELYHGFNYQADRPFFHTFATDTYAAGLSFADENEAGTLYHKVVGRDELLKAKGSTIQPTNSGPVAATPSRSSGWFGSKSSSKKKERPKVDKARIGLPSNFQHLGHIGWDAEKGFNVEKIPSDWKNLFDTAGITEDQLKDEETAKFVYDFVQSRGGPKSAEKPRNASPARAPPPSAAAPPPPPSGAARRPPPPPPRQRNAGQGPVPNRNGAPPPSLPDRAVSEPNPAAQLASAPPMPSRSPSPVRPSVVPPAPPPFVSGSAPAAPPPPPPPPVPAPFAPPIPAPTVHPSASRIAPADGVRVDLLASIRSAGVTSLKPATAREPPSPPPEEASAGGDLASALASALAARSKAITTDSDDEEEDGDDWD